LATCGEPIEGPCAVSHVGDRYHPEHLTCEYEYSGSHNGVRADRCSEVLLDYWEIDGRMLCERHARIVERGEDDAPSGARSKRATRRQTRLINLAGLPGSGR
jgi:PDZ and LIM domain protein 5/6/7